MADEEGATPESTPDPAPATEDQPLGEAGEKALEAFKQRAREAEARIKELEPLAAQAREIEEAQKSEVQKAQDKLAKEAEARKAAESKLLRFEVAAEKEVPADALDFLVGDTREELEAKADKLLELVKSRNETDSQPDFDGGPREPTDDPKTPDQAHSDLILKLAGYSN